MIHTTAITVIIIIILIIIIYLISYNNNKSMTKNIRTFNRFIMFEEYENNQILESVNTSKFKTEIGLYDPEKSIKLLKSTFNDNNIKYFFNKFLNVYHGYKKLYGIKNYGGKIEWEFYTLPRQPIMDVEKWYNNYKQLFPNDTYNLSNMPNEHLICISIDINAEILETGRTLKLNTYDKHDGPAYYMEEYTYRHDGTRTHRGDSFMYINVLSDDEHLKYLAKEIGMNDVEISNSIRFIRNIGYNYNFITYSYKEKEFGIYFFGVDYESFKHFIFQNNYGQQIEQYVMNNKQNLDKDFALEVGFYFKKEDVHKNIMHATRTAFYANF